MFIKPNQIRAARGLLDWTVAELAQKVGVGTTTISAIETGRSSGSVEILTSIMYTFQNAGVELNDDGGVRPIQNKTVIYRGREGIKQFYDDIYQAALTKKDIDACVTIPDEDVFDSWVNHFYDDYNDKMRKIEGLNIRLILTEVDANKYNTPYIELRGLPKDRFIDTAIYIYATKTAFIEFLDDDVIVTVSDSPAIAKCLRKIFELDWKKAKSVA